MSGFFKSKPAETKTTFEQDPLFKGVTSAQAADLQSRIGQPGPAFTGERVAPLSPLQQTGLQKAQQFANQPIPQAFGLAQSEFVRQLTPQDPANTFLFKAVQEGARRNLRQSIDQISDISGGTGRAFSGARLEQESKAVEGTTINLNQILGQLALEQERQRISAAERLPGIAQQIAEFPLQQAAAATQFGEIPRGLEQAQLDADFQEFIRRFVEEPQNVSNLANQFIGLGAPQPITTVTPGQASPFSQLAPLIGTAAGSLLGPLGAAAGGALASKFFGPKTSGGAIQGGPAVTSQGISVPSTVSFK